MEMPDGLELITDFLTSEEETTILAAIPKKPTQGAKGDRNSVQRFGARDAYTSGTYNPTIPKSLIALGQKLVDAGHLAKPPTKVTVNEYCPGNALVAHIDKPDCGPVITVVSLLSPATMVFSRDKFPSYTVELPPRSVVFMRGESRYLWKHAVLPLAAPRYSIVFRP